MWLRLIATCLVLAGCGGEAAPKASPPPLAALQCAGSGRPVVVLESGFGNDAHEWSAIQPRLARTTKTCAYDRAGSGSSVAPPGIRDARDQIGDLVRLLGRAHLDGPYVLVGHSYGGVLGRVFAHLHPDDTAGIVLVDSMGVAGRRRQLAVWPRSQSPEERRELATTVDQNVDIGAGERLADALTTLGDTPLAVVTAGRHPNFPPPPRLHRAIARVWATLQDELAGLSTDSIHVVALRSTHDVPLSGAGQPAVVTAAAQAVVLAVRDRAPLPPCRRIFSGPGVRCR